MTYAHCSNRPASDASLERPSRALLTPLSSQPCAQTRPPSQADNAVPTSPRSTRTSPTPRDRTQLRGRPGEPCSPEDHDVVEEHIRGMAAILGPAPCNAAWFADQNKAFERVAMHWTARTLHRWGFPTWLQRSLLRLCQKRAVQFLGVWCKGPLRQLRRSVGMGGAAPPLL